MKLRPMLWLGLTGCIGCGKSTVAQLLRDQGIPVVDADKYARQALLPTNPPFKIFLSVFGSEYLTTQGEVDRKRLAGEVFSHPAKRRVLEGIIHPWVQDQVAQEKKQLLSQGHGSAFYDVPLLFEKKLQDRFDGILVVASQPQVQQQRLQARNQWSDEEVARRMAAQSPIEEKVAGATWVIHNDGSLQQLEAQVAQVVERLKNFRP